jgi:K+-sensing histidine kinase KdpD
MDKISQAKELFISITAHKLLTPLTLIKWNLELLKKDARLSEASKQKINDIDESVQKLDCFSNILMKIVQTKADGSNDSNKVNKLYKINIQKVIDNVKKELSLNDILRVETNLNLNTEKDLSLEEKELQYILSAVLENAALYNQNKPDLKIEVLEEAERIVFIVTDNGIGIPVDEQPLIGDAFYRSSNSQKLSVKGFGLSIYTCKLMLENIKGSLEIKSDGENLGSKCKVKI